VVAVSYTNPEREISDWSALVDGGSG